MWWALPPEERGHFFAPQKLHTYLSRYHIHSAPRYKPGHTLVVAGWPNAGGSRHKHVVMMEHGVGQTYGRTSQNYADGAGRDKIHLVLAPNQRVADFAPSKSVVVGTPLLDSFFTSPPPKHPSEGTVAFAFHWRCTNAPEAGTAFDHYRDAVSHAHDSSLSVVGHGHPRMMDELRRFYHRHQIPVWPHMSQVLQNARVLVCDNSSIMYFFAALGKPVVVLNAPWWDRSVSWGLRFWDQADVGLQVDEPSDLLTTVLLAMEDPPAVQERRAEISREVVPIQDGTSARRAAEAILGLP